MISNTLVASSFSAGGATRWWIRSAHPSSITRCAGLMVRAGGGPPLRNQFEIVAGWYPSSSAISVIVLP